MLEFDELIAKEIYFDNQVLEEGSEKKFNALLIWIVGALQSGKSMKTIKSYIRNQDVDANLEKNLLKTFREQQAIILGKDKNFDLSQESIAGLTFNELIKERKLATEKRAIKFAARSKDLLKTERKVEKFIKEETGRYAKNAGTFWKTETKSAREYAYETEEKKIKIKGWISVAILDNRTSPVCAGLHNKFYSIEDFASRSEIPEQPPRHPNCRSVLFAVRSGENVNKYKSENLDTFMKRNPKIAKNFLGQKKYKLWSENKEKLDNYIDLKRRRFYTNKEIIKKLGAT